MLYYWDTNVWTSFQGAQDVATYPMVDNNIKNIHNFLLKLHIYEKKPKLSTDCISRISKLFTKPIWAAVEVPPEKKIEILHVSFPQIKMAT